MAASINNACTYAGCLKTFRFNHDLILHIENDHLDLSAATCEQLELEQPDALPLSYIQQYGRPGEVANECETNSTVPKQNFVDKGLQTEGFRFVGMDRKHATKPYVCIYPDCHKRYKNLNGIKYHQNKNHKNICQQSDKPKTLRKDKAEDAVTFVAYENGPLLNGNFQYFVFGPNS